MFEKSKSAITFKEFQDKLNIVNNFESDWGHFCYIDYNDDDKNENNKININKSNININKSNININKNNSNNLLKNKKYFVDIEKLEKQNKKEVPKPEYNDESKCNDESEYNDEPAITVIRGCLTVIQLTLITIVVGYFIFKIV